MNRFLATGVIAITIFAAPLQAPEAHEPVDPASIDVRHAYATLLGLDLEGEEPVTDGETDVYRSSPDSAQAPRLVTRLEVSGNACLVRTTSALQSPGGWAVLSLTRVDLRKVEHAVAYASVDDLIAEHNPLAPADPGARQMVLEGRGLSCTTRISLDGASRGAASACEDRLDISMIDDQQAARVRAALELMGRKCGIEAVVR
ncbi:hypothetical protein SAMN05892877_106199 [Rhizobium subbaraonis]|uniref:Uncharacterized protein n=1 Tax=Rhizobium subbaraonis TaxID=908946 RepID=A0A285UDC8_9HYPH|nr:hypothetical protein [Rhizobium subbaraonis]SOC39799.1 hypothetical protein SAMN05892877_106199 [Rhizobium subbaraonis]